VDIPLVRTDKFACKPYDRCSGVASVEVEGLKGQNASLGGDCCRQVRAQKYCRMGDCDYAGSIQLEFLVYWDQACKLDFPPVTGVHGRNERHAEQQLDPYVLLDLVDLLLDCGVEKICVELYQLVQRLEHPYASKCIERVSKSTSVCVVVLLPVNLSVREPLSQKESDFRLVCYCSFAGVKRLLELRLDVISLAHVHCCKEWQLHATYSDLFAAVFF